MDAAVAANLQSAQSLQLQMQELSKQLDASSITLALARRRDALAALEAELRCAGGWDAVGALQLALLWLVAGVPGRGDDLVLEADQLEPHGGLIPIGGACGLRIQLPRLGPALLRPTWRACMWSCVTCRLCRHGRPGCSR